MKPIYFIVLALAIGSISPLSAYPQSYYPGGLGNSNLILWLDANKSSSITMNGSNQVAQWSDLSGSGNHFLQSTTANKPVYVATAAPNGMPALTFTSTSSQYLSLATLSSSLSFTSGVSAFAQSSYSATQTSQGWQRIFDFGNGTGSDNLMMGRYGNTANNYYEGWKGTTGDQTYTTTSPIVNSSESTYEAIQQGGTAGTLTAVTHYLAGTAQTAAGAAGSSQTWVPASIARTSNYLGRSNWAADNYLSGTLSEILIYNTALNNTQRVILENYLAAEWNQTISSRKYTPPSSTTYTTNLVGIGYSGTDYFAADLAGSTDGLGFSSGTTAADFLGTAGYLMAAHNAQSNTVITNASVPGIVSGSALGRWNRSWYLQPSAGNSPGAVSVVFNFADYNSSSPSSANTYTLLYNATDGSFATGTNQLVTTSATTVSTGSNTVTFKVTAANLSAGYYTILYSASAIVLPVDLTVFTASRLDHSALLEWSTDQPAAIHQFDVQRSADGMNFKSIASVPASAAGSYSYTDVSPANGSNFYRLALRNYDATTTYSRVLSVGFGPGEGLFLVSLYPNPVADRVHVEWGSTAADVEMRLLNSQGQMVHASSVAGSKFSDISLSGLSKGIYFLSIRIDKGTPVVRSILKQ